MKPYITLLALDPGTNNFAASVIKCKNKNGKLVVRLVGTSMIKEAVKDVINCQKAALDFKNKLVDLKTKYDFDCIVAERFQTRGLRGKTVECINIMLGIILNEFQDMDVTLLTAATWKNRYNTNSSLNDLYLDLKDAQCGIKPALRKTIHELDCSLMGIYRACVIFKLPHFANISSYQREQAFLNHFLQSPIL